MSDARPHLCMVDLGMGDGLPEFPLDERYARRLVARIALARRIAADGMALSREAAVFWRERWADIVTRRPPPWTSTCAIPWNCPTTMGRLRS